MESLDFEDYTVEELLTSSVWDSGLYPDSKIYERVINLFKIQDKQEKDLDLKIKEQELKINELKAALRDA